MQERSYRAEQWEGEVKNYRTYQWEGEGEELQSLLVGKCRRGVTELIRETVQERTYRAN